MAALVHEKVWVDKKLYDDAERQFYESQAKLHCSEPPQIIVTPVALPIIARIHSSSSKKHKQKNMPPVQNVGSAVPAPASPKKSKKNKKGKNNANRNMCEREKVSVEKEVSVEKSPDVTNECVKPAEVPLDVNTVKQVTAVKGGLNQPSGQCSLASEVAKARQHIKNSLECMDSVAALAGVPNVDVLNKINSLEKENQDLKKTVEELRKSLKELKINFETFTSKFSGSAAPAPTAKAAAVAKAPAPKEDSDDGVDLFGSDDEEESAEAARIREERLAAYNAKKSKKPVLIAKSNIILDVKPWDDETDMAAMETAVRGVTTEGLLWGAAKLVPLAYGIHKLQISCVVEDDKVSIDWLTEELEKIEDFVQSVDIAAFNKV